MTYREQTDCPQMNYYQTYRPNVPWTSAKSNVCAISRSLRTHAPLSQSTLLHPLTGNQIPFLTINCYILIYYKFFLFIFVNPINIFVFLHLEKRDGIIHPQSRIYTYHLLKYQIFNKKKNEKKDTIHLQFRRKKGSLRAPFFMQVHFNNYFFNLDFGNRNLRSIRVFHHLVRHLLASLLSG